MAVDKMILDEKYNSLLLKLIHDLKNDLFIIRSAAFSMEKNIEQTQLLQQKLDAIQETIKKTNERLREFQNKLQS